MIVFSIVGVLALFGVISVNCLQPLLLAPKKDPFTTCTFEKCLGWRFLERTPSWHSTKGNGTSGPSHDGYLYHNETGYALMASLPLRPVDMNKPSPFCISVVYQMCGHENNSLSLVPYPYPLPSDMPNKTVPIWSERQVTSISLCSGAWQVQVAHIFVATPTILLLNGTIVNNKETSAASPSKILLNNIEVFNTTCEWVTGSGADAEVVPYRPSFRPRVPVTPTVLQGERFGRIESSLDGSGHIFKNESWRITATSLHEYYYYYDYYDHNVPVESTKMTVIALQFSWLDIENSSNCSLASVSFYDGPNDSFPLIATFCGNERPRDIYQASTDTIFIAFHIFGPTNPAGSGFKISYTGISVEATTLPPTSTTPAPSTTTRDVSELYRYFCDFEDGSRFCSSLFKNWNLATFNWYACKGTDEVVRQSYSGLPTKDRSTNTANGYFAVALASRRIPGDIAALVTTRDFSRDEVDCINFWYYKSGSQTGRLAVLVEYNGKIETVLVIRSSQTDNNWHNAQVAVPWKINGRFKVTFQFTVGADLENASNIAIDDVGFFKAIWCATVAALS